MSNSFFHHLLNFMVDVLVKIKLPRDQSNKFASNLNTQVTVLFDKNGYEMQSSLVALSNNIRIFKCISFPPNITLAHVCVTA